jgi:HAD superfamily hydrolase (TIGR01509 family)
MSQLKAVMFGATGAVAETADLQRQAFNAAFKQAGLDWKWSAIAYKDLLKTAGGAARIRAFRDSDPSRSDVSDKMVDELQAAKDAAFVDLMTRTKLSPRPGVKELMDACIGADVKLAWCTSSSPSVVKAIKQSLAKQLPLKQVESTVTSDRIQAAKPSPDSYLQGLKDLGLTAAEVVTIEDTPAGVEAAKAAGIVTLATPGDTTAGQDFSAADRLATSLSSVTLQELQELAASAN